MLNFHCFAAHFHASTAADQKMQSGDEAEARAALSCGDNEQICDVDNYFVCLPFWNCYSTITKWYIRWIECRLN